MSKAADVEAEELSEASTDELIAILSLNLHAIDYEKNVLMFYAEKWPKADAGQAGMDSVKLANRTRRIHAVVQELLKRQREVAGAATDG
jgi:hypothetical protein